MKILISILLLCFVAGGCYSTSDRKEGVVALSEDINSGLNKTITVGIYQYCCQYKSASYIAAKEGLDAVAASKRIRQLDSTVWFNVGISIKGASINPLKYNVASQEEYNQRLSFFIMEAQNHFTLSYNGLELNPFACHFENNYGLTPMDMMIVGFKIPDTYPDKDMVLSYTDELYRNGILKFGIKAQNIQSIQ